MSCIAVFSQKRVFRDALKAITKYTKEETMKRIIISMLAGLCMIGFTACGNESSKSSSTSVPAATEAVTQETQEQSSEADTDTDDKKAPVQTESVSESSDTNEGTGNDTIVVYFSATGTTKGVAERIAQVTGADTFEIVPAEPYTDADLNWNDDNSRSTLEMNDPDARPAIDGDTVDLNGYSTVYIGYPIWWGDAPRIMSTFVESHSFDGMTVIPFCTSGSSPIGRSGSNLASLAGSGNWLDGERLNSSISESEIQDWINDLN